MEFLRRLNRDYPHSFEIWGVGLVGLGLFLFGEGVMKDAGMALIAASGSVDLVYIFLSTAGVVK